MVVVLSFRTAQEEQREGLVVEVGLRDLVHNQLDHQV